MDDLISRQEAIDALNRLCPYPGEWSVNGLGLCKDAIANLPSIDAVIRCKDCKWWDKSEDSPFGYCMAMKHGYFSANWEIGIYRRYKGDFYCADAERKET